jgi:hypothetical protein
MITQRLGFVSGASAASVLRATDELAEEDVSDARESDEKRGDVGELGTLEVG